MAIVSTALYASVDEYKGRQTTDDSDANLTSLLIAASRYLDDRLGIVPGGFSDLGTQTYLFKGSGRRRLYLRGDTGRMYPLRSVEADEIRPDYEATGVFTTGTPQWDTADAWVWPWPRNRTAGHPFYVIELRAVGSAPYTVWPYDYGGSVQIKGTWGWDVPPPEIRELTIQVARDMRRRPSCDPGPRSPTGRPGPAWPGPG